MKRLFPILSLIFVFGLLAAACAPTAAATGTATPADTAITLVDGLGRTVTLAAPAQKVVSLAPSNTEMLFALGAGAQVAGRDDFSNYPEEALAIASVGGSMGDYNLEEIARLQPDLVLVAEINTPELVNALENLELTVFYLSNPDDIEGIYTNLEIVGKLAGRAAQAEALIASLQARVGRIDAALETVTDQPLVFYELDATDPAKPWTAGPGTFLNLLVQRAKGKNVGAVLSAEWAQISQEELLVQNPDVILLGNANWGMTAEMVAGRPGWQQIKAVADGRVYAINDDLISRPGPRQVDGLEEMVRLLHPQLTEELKQP
ncbi:MAG TPA: cobalamin-binding protein [Levilinea sp.]|nr:cobalamin-binding protein [Levilinea sp.]